MLFILSRYVFMRFAFVAVSLSSVCCYRVDQLLGHSLAILCERLKNFNCDLFQPSSDASLRSRWVNSSVFAETRSTFFRCCHLRHTEGSLDLNFADGSIIPALIPVPSDGDEQYIADFARKFQGAYLDVGSGSDASVCRNTPFPGMGISVEPVEFLADAIPETCPHVRALVGNINGESNVYEINLQALEALYGKSPEGGSLVPEWMKEASTPLPIFRVLKENAITREVGTFVEDLFYERKAQMATIRSILDLGSISDRKLLIRLRAGGLEPLVVDEISEISPEVLILSHEFMELVDLAKIVQAMQGSCALSLKYLFCSKDTKLFDSVIYGSRSLLRTLDI